MHSIEFPVSFARRMPAPPDAPAELSGTDTHILRIRARDLPKGIPDDANPREPNLNRQVYRKVGQSLVGDEGPGAFHLKHGGITIIAERVEKCPGDIYKLHFDPSVKQGVVNGNHSYKLILEKQDSDAIPDNQYVELKVHTGIPADVVPDLAEGLNTSMQVREESLADLRNQFDWLKVVTQTTKPNGYDAISWHEGDDGQYDVREVIALLMALDPDRFPLEDPVGVENTYARLSTVFRQYLSDPTKVERFSEIAVEAMELYEYIRITARDVWLGGPSAAYGKFRSTVLADRKTNGNFEFPFLGRQSDTRLTKAATVPCFAAFRALVELPKTGPARWRYDFAEVKTFWDEHGGELLREVHDAVTKQHGGQVHYAGRNVMLYRATTKTLELADLRRRLRS